MEDLSEKEQIDAMRSWWKENGRFVISGIVLGVVILVSWNRWQVHQETTGLEASELFETLAVEVHDGDLEGAESAAANRLRLRSTTLEGLHEEVDAAIYVADDEPDAD